MDCFDLTKDIMNEAYVIAQCTNKLRIDKLVNISDSGDGNDIDNMRTHGLDIRIFNKNQEIRYFRPTIGEKFVKRVISDTVNSDGTITPGCGKDYFDQKQFLDIDTHRSKELIVRKQVMATGGGIYDFPMDNMNDAQVCIRNYIDFDSDTGRAFVVDFRCVDI